MTSRGGTDKAQGTDGKRAAMELTPMMQQYKETKEQHPDEILFFRLGDFYEMFFEDARVASKELGLTLTSRSGDVEKTPMCGVPYHSAERYIEKLISRGYKVAIAEQMGDPKAPGLTKREVIKVVTPGTIHSSISLKSSPVMAPEARMQAISSSDLTIMGDIKAKI